MIVQKTKKKLKELSIEAAIPNRYGKIILSDFKFKDGLLICPAGETTSNYINQEKGRLYYFSVNQCKHCGRKNKCLNKKAKRKRVYLSYSRQENLKSWEKYRYDTKVSIRYKRIKIFISKGIK